MLGERLDRSGFLGVFLIAAGSYVLHIDQAVYGIFRPIKAIFYVQGSWIMIIVAGIYSITSILAKMAIQETSPVFFAIFHSGMMALLMLPLLMIFSEQSVFKGLKEQIWIFMAIGFTMALMVLSHMMAVIRVEVAYMISIKRTSPIFTVILGCILLQEKDFSERLIGSAIMFLGVLLILL